MTTTTYLLLLLIAILAMGALWLMNGRITDAEAAHIPVDPDESDILGHEAAAAERLRREADATQDPHERASLLKLAEEADVDIDKLARDIEEQSGKK